MAKIAIDAGHGLYTYGKRCLRSLDPNETREWVLNDRVADALGEYLKSAGHTILRVDNVSGSTDISLANRVKQANNWKADAYISVHHNAGINGGTGGGTVVYVSKNCSSKSVQIQNAVYKHAIADCNLKGNRSDGTLASNFYVIRNTNMPAILIEAGFMDSRSDIKYILDSNWSKKMGLAIAKGVCDVYGGTIKGTVVTATPSIPSTPSKPSAPTSKVNKKVQEWQKEAIADGFRFPKYGADGQWGAECIAVAKKAIVKKRSVYKYRNLTRIVQRAVGVPVDGKCGKDTREGIIAYQKKHGLTADGCVGLNTWKKILGV